MHGTFSIPNGSPGRRTTAVGGLWCAGRRGRANRAGLGIWRCNWHWTSRSISASTGLVIGRNGDPDLLRGEPVSGVPGAPGISLTDWTFWRWRCQARRCCVQNEGSYADRGLRQGAILGLMWLNFLSVSVSRKALR